MRRMIRDCSAAIGERLARIPDGEWSERFYMAGLGAEDRAAHRFTCHIRKGGDRLVVSNEGTDPQYKAASSAYGSWRSGVLVAVGSFLGWDQLLCNDGRARSRELRADGGNVECGHVSGRDDRGRR